MTDDQQTREERAFRAAFDRQADAYAAAPLRTDGKGRQRTWPLVLSAAAALVLVVGGITALVKYAPSPQDEASNIADSSTTTSTTSDETHVTASCVNDACVDTSLPAPADGWKWVSWRNVAVQVPDTWGYGSEPEGMGCGRSAPPDPATPYVALDQTDQISGDVGCGIQGDPAIPSQMQRLNGDTTDPAYWRVHLTFSDRHDAGTPGWIQYGGWTLATTGVEGSNVAISLLDGDDDRATMERIYGSATTFTVDQNGCPATSDFQDDVEYSHITRNVTAISICQYATNLGSGTPNLMASRLLTDTSARDLVAAIEAAPTGQGPDRAWGCSPPWQNETLIELRLAHEDAPASPLTVRYDGCQGNGIYGLPTVRALTKADCQPLFAELPIQILSGLESVFDVCTSE